MCAKEIIKYPRVGCGVMFLKDNMVLLGRRHDDPEKASSELDGEGTWTMPGGKLDYLEEPKKGLIREIVEETGLVVGEKDLNLISVTNDISGGAHFVTLGFICERIDGDPQVLEPDEITEWRWFDLDALPERVFPPSLKIIKNYLDKETYKN